MKIYTLTKLDGDNAGYNIDCPDRTFLKLNVNLEDTIGGTIVEYRIDCEMTIDWPEDEDGNGLGTVIKAQYLNIGQIADVLEYLDSAFYNAGVDYYEELFEGAGGEDLTLTFSKP
jgi:hypothetical protein